MKRFYFSKNIEHSVENFFAKISQNLILILINFNLNQSELFILTKFPTYFYADCD